MDQYAVYILTNDHGNVMYVGVTNDLERRVNEHKSHLIPGFTKKYNISKLVYFEQTLSIESAILREKEIKAWRREKKNMLVEVGKSRVEGFGIITGRSLAIARDDNKMLRMTK